MAGFLATDATRQGVAHLAEATEPLLLVIDEANAHVDQAALVLRESALLGRGAPTRLLLVSREAGDWLSATLPEQLIESPEARLVLTKRTVHELGPLDPTGAGRELAFAEAMNAFADKLGVAADSTVVPDVSSPVFESVLFLHLGALNALVAGADALVGVAIEKNLLQFALERERRYWMATAHAAKLDAVLARASACGGRRNINSGGE